MSQPQRFVFQSYAANQPGQDICICILTHLYLLMKQGCIFYRKITLPPLFIQIIFPSKVIYADMKDASTVHTAQIY